MDRETRASRADTYLTRAAEALQQGNAALAQAEARKALALAPQDLRAHQLMAQVYQRSGKAVLAQRCLATMRALMPTAPAQPAGNEPMPELSPTQRRLLLEGAMRCLARLSVTGSLLEQAGLAGSSEQAAFEQ